MKNPTPSASRHTHLIAMLAAFCLFFSIIEYLIPKPLPFMRLGLANLPILIALSLFPSRKVLLLVLLKILGQGLINGTLFSYIFLFSTAGSLASGFIMILTYRGLKHRVSLLGVSMLGALASNFVQLLLARYFIFGQSALIIGPPFLIIGTISAIMLGIFAERFTEQSEWYKGLAK